jgi:hypothetical protein
MVGDGIVALRACVDEAGWVSLETLGGLGSPPPPAYIWDLVLEIGQARLHDGGLGEGQASAEIPVSELAIGPTAQELIDLIRANLAENLQLLRELTVIAGDNSTGAADFYYYRSKAGEDWLVFVEPLDIAIAADGGPTRPYGYEHPGFYADPELERRSSTRDSVDGDASHEKLRIIAGTRAFVEDDARHVFQIDVGDKPSPQRIELLITRVR